MARVDDLLSSPDARHALAQHDIGAVFRLLNEGGVPQRKIAYLTGMSQSEVGRILAGRRVRAVVVLERICRGLGVKPGLMGLAYADETTPAAPPSEEVDEAVKRRAFINAAGAAVMGAPVLHNVLSDPLTSTPATPLPSRLGEHDVGALEHLIERMRTVARLYGGQSEVVGPIADRSMQMMSVPTSDPLRARLSVALSELHTVAGWCSFDAHADDRARHHFTRAVELGDPYGSAYAMYHAGCMHEERGDAQGALRLFQMGQVRLSETGDDRAPRLASWLRADSAGALAHLGRPRDARGALNDARAEWEPDTSDDSADMDWLTSLVQLDLGDVDAAEAMAATAVRQWESSSNRRDAVLGDITLATIHVQAAEPDAARLAERAVTNARALRSQRARDRLAPLGEALVLSRQGECRALARQLAAV